MTDKKILDMTCGSRTIWFNKKHPAVVYCDKRREEFFLPFGKARTNWRKCVVEPDVQCDFTALPFPDESFSLVVFDPPHLTGAKETAWLVKKYGKLDETWPKMLHDGFREGMRVLKPDGVLIFKWSEYDMDGATGLCDHCAEKHTDARSLKSRCARICEIDKALHRLFDEQYHLYHDGLTTEQYNRLSKMVMKDGLPHFT